MSGLILPSGTGVTGLWGKSAGTATAPTTPAATGGGLFGGAATTNTGTGTGTAAGTGGGLFGAGSTATSTAASTTTTTTATAGGGLFGSSTPAAAPAGGGLFGSSTPAAAAPAGGGLFGSTPAAAPAGGGLFGSTPAAATTGTTPLFGATASNPQPASQQSASGGGGLTFGCAPVSTTGGLNLGGAATSGTPAATTGGLFGSGTAAAAPTSAGGLFGQTTTQPATQVSAVQINYDSMRPRSRFDDLAPPVQSEIDLIDKGIQRVIKMRDEIGQFMPQHEKDIEQLGRDVHFVEAKFRTVQDALNRDIQTVKVLQDMTKKNIADGQLSFKAADNLKLPTHYHQTGLFAAGPAAAAAAGGESGSGDASSAHASAQDLITYFNRICDDVERYKRRLDEYRSQIERDMPGVENGLYEQIRSLRDASGSAPVQDQLNQVLLALKETGNAIVAQAGVIADTRERLSRLQAGYLDGGLSS